MVFSGFVRGCVRSLLFLIVGLGVVRACYAQAVETSVLVSDSKNVDGKTVTLEGEAIGDIMIRGAYAWVNLRNGSTALGVWMPAEAARSISRGGSYAADGDLIRVTGIFHRVCAEHGGDMDLHAPSVVIVKPGAARDHAFSPGKKKLAVRLFGVVVLLWILSRLKNR